MNNTEKSTPVTVVYSVFPLLYMPPVLKFTIEMKLHFLNLCLTFVFNLEQLDCFSSKGSSESKPSD